MRPVTPAMFIRLPARMKNGTASSGKLSTPEIMRCASVTSGVMPVTRIYSSDDAAIESATGRPRSISIRNPPSSSSIASALRSVERAGALQYRIAAPPVLYRNLDRTAEHQHEAEQHGVIDKPFLEFDRRHPLVADELDIDPDQLGGVAEERDPDQVDDGGKRPRRQMRQIAVHQIDLDMPRQPHAYCPRSAPLGASSSNVWAISFAEICLCTSAVDTSALDMGSLSNAGMTGRPPARRRQAEEKPNRLFHRLDTIPVGLAVVEAFEARGLDHGVAEFVLVDLGDGQPLLLEEIDQLGLVHLDLGRGLGSRFLGDVGEY